MGPIFEKLEFSFFPAVVTDFFYAALQKIKSSREAVKQKVWLFVHVCKFSCPCSIERISTWVFNIKVWFFMYFYDLLKELITFQITFMQKYKRLWKGSQIF